MALGNYYNFGNEEVENYLQLGPLELKLLSITGESKPIYGLSDTEEGETAREYNPAEWPVSQPMLKEAITPRKHLLLPPIDDL